IFSISFLVDRMQRTIADTKDYFEVIDQQPHTADILNAKSLKVSRAKIELRNLSFSYDIRQPVLKDINLTIEPDSKVALVGESGEGKTTLTNLLMRLYEPEKGEILIDDQNIADVSLKSLRSAIGTVFQEPALFSGTVRE